MTIEELMKALTGGSGSARSGDELRQTAEAQTKAAYDQKRLSARQTAESEDAALARELETLRSGYEDRLLQSEADTRSTLSQADRTALSRGMQRSSYTNATLANIALQGNAARERIGAERSAAEESIAGQRAQTASRLAEQLAGYDAQQQADAAAALDTLRSREEERQAQDAQNRNALLMKLYEYSYQAERDAQAQRNWQAEFERRYGPKRSATGSKSAGASSGGTASGDGTADSLAALLAKLKELQA